MRRRAADDGRATSAPRSRARPCSDRTGAIARLGMFALMERDPHAVMEEAARVASGTLGVELAAILEVAPSADHYIRRASVGYRAAPAPALSSRVAGLANYTVLRMEPVIVDDFAEEVRFSCSPLVDEGIVSALSVVIRVPGPAPVVHGALIAGARAPRGFGPEDVAFMEAVSSVAGAAIHRRRVEEQLRESEERFAQLSAAMRDGALVPLDPHGSIAGWNAPAERLFGRRAEAVIGKHFSGLAAEEDAIRGSVNEPLQAAARDGQAEGEAWLVRRDGAPFRASLDVFALRGVGDALRGFAVAVRDVTAHFEAEAARAQLAAEVERQRDLLQAVIEQFPAGVVIFDDAESGRVAAVSRQAEAIWRRPHPLGKLSPGYSDEFPSWSLDGRRLGDADFGGTRALRGETVRQELTLQRGDGTFALVRDTASPLYDRHGRIIGGIAAFYDISAEKAREQERERLLEDTRRAVRSRDDVLAVVSHDLRNPLGVIMFAAAQLARRLGAADPSGAGPLVEQIHRATSGMERIMTDLLDFARIESGRLVIELADADAAEVVREAVELFGVLVDRQGVTLQATLDGLAGARVHCDRGRVVQVLSNLLGNALKFVPRGRGIEVGGYRAGREVVIFVRDEGPGLRPEDLPHLFDRYWQAEREHGKRGLGLGLAIVKGIVEGHGGRVWAESPPGQGATFSFSLPLSR